MAAVIFGVIQSGIFMKRLAKIILIFDIPGAFHLLADKESAHFWTIPA
jgi:hypothetical protein